GENVNLLEGIIAEDNLEGNITSKVRISNNNLDINKIGEYTIEYAVSNKLGIETKVNRKINVVEVPKLEKNVMNILGIENHLSFNIGFDDFTKTFKLFNRHDGVMHYVLKNHEYFSIQILDKNMKEKLNISLKGGEKPTSYKLNNLENLKYEYGDFIKIYHKEPRGRLKIDGEIIDGKENYADGINNINNVDEVRNMAFQITENGLKYIYNNKPEIKGVKDIIIRQGEIFNKLEGINAIDDIDGDITSKINVVGDLDTNKIGEYKVNYTVEDSWGRQSKATSHINVISKPKLENNFMQIKGIAERGTGEEKFKIGFDDIKKELKVYDLRDSTMHQYFAGREYFAIKIINKNRKEKLSIELRGENKGTSNKLDVLKNFKYAYGDRIKLRHGESNRLDINGEVIDAKIDYSQRIWFDTNDVEFEITENGLKAIYNEVPVITGVENTTIKIGEVFDSLEGVIVKDDHDKNLVPVVIGNVDVNKLGNYELTYSVRDNWGAEQTVKRVITVRSNNKPAITGTNKTIINVGEPFNIMDGISANDVEDNDLTSSIKVKGVVNNNLVGTYIITYTVTDSDGNKVNVARTVVVKSNNKPIITGTENTEIKVGDTFDALFEVEATDTEDGDLTELINVKGTVNTEVKGIYDLIYSIKDKDGNEAVATRRVIVKSNDKPVLQGIKNSVIKIGDTFDKLVGITAIDTEDKDLTTKISVEGEVVFSKPGVYKLIYNVIDNDGNKVSKIRTVTVKSNNKPTLEGVNNITIKVGDDFEPLVDISANDMEDGDITELIKVENKVDTSNPGEYEVIYSVTDLDKNTTSEKRIVTVRSNDKPIIDGVGKLNLKVGDNFDPRYNVTAADTEDKDLTQSIKITGTVDTTKEGVTTLIYSVLDSDGNETSVKRHITVRSNNKPTIIGI
ncbi:MAG: immunoglobulin-like domain-containing protein, partial [Sarcina sp.]